MRSVDKKTALRAGLSAVVGVLIYVGLVLLVSNGIGDQVSATVLPVDYRVGFETGDFSELGPSPFTNSGDAEAVVVTDPTHTGEHALAMTVTDADSGTAVRTRIDNDVFQDRGYSGGHNLPDEAYFSVWFYVPEYVSLGGGDPWNIFQFKQTYPVTGSGYTRRMIDAIKLWDLGGDYGFTLKSNIDAEGNWDSGNFREWQSDEVRVSPGEWFQVKVLRTYGDSDAGHNTVWVNDVEIFDLDMATEMYGDAWDDYGPWRRQWTVNNYVTGDNHDPNTQTLFIDDLEIRTD